MQGAAPGVRSVLSSAPGGSGKSTVGVATMSMVSVLTPGAALAIDSPLCRLGIPGTLRPATAGGGSRAGDQLETSFREPMAVHPSADLRPLRAGPTDIGKINRRCQKSWSRQQAWCRRRLAVPLSERQGEARKCRSRRSAGLLLHSDDDRFPGPHPKGTDPRKTNTNRMVILAKGLKARQAGEYSGSMKRTPSMKVVETPWFRRRAPQAASS